MVIFHSYVSLPEGTIYHHLPTVYLGSSYGFPMVFLIFWPHQGTKGSPTCSAVVFSSVAAYGGRAYSDIRRRPGFGKPRKKTMG